MLLFTNANFYIKFIKAQKSRRHVKEENFMYVSLREIL